LADLSHYVSESPVRILTTYARSVVSGEKKGLGDGVPQGDEGRGKLSEEGVGAETVEEYEETVPHGLSLAICSYLTLSLFW